MINRLEHSMLEKALLALDTTNPDNWTNDGLPRLDVLKNSLGKTVTRMEIHAIAPGFCRDNPVIKNSEQPAPEGELNSVAEGSGCSLTDKINSLQVNIDELTVAKNKLERELLALNNERDKLIIQRDGVDVRKSTMHDIKAFQKSQFEQRQAQAARKAAIVDLIEKSGI